MTPEQWAEVKERFHEALEQPSQVRDALLSAKCSSETVRQEVERLLFEHSRSNDFLTWPAVAPLGALNQAFDGGEDDFRGNTRFTVQRKLGAGTFGVVFKVFDRERNSVVALKKLRKFDATHLMRFKREFRSLVDLVHPNLVQLYELFGEPRQWFFTMELVEGVDFLSYVRPGGYRTDWERLREGAFQLATGVQALHSSGRLHRDLKPSNVLVTPEGRVVILDFGLVREFESSSVEQSIALAGSPAYMAPEQAAGRAINEAADWYAVGVMLFRAMTGQLPYPGTVEDTLKRKQVEDAPRCRDIAPEIPEDLDEACRHLLERRPENRSAGVKFLLEQGPQFVKSEVRTQEEFVGREWELRLLHERFTALSSGNRQMVLIEGQSGIGKTSLITHFLANLKQERPDAVVLRGRCRESETVPYKALDPIADEIARHLKSIPEAVAMALLPRHPELLRRLFPVFGELDIISPNTERGVAADADEQQMRRRAFEALSELLARMSDRSPVVIAIDDLQWGDLDSIAFLAELVLPANAPALMLLLSFRSEEANISPPVKALRKLQHQLRDADSWVEIEMQGLSAKEGRHLLDLLQKKTSAITEEQLGDILREAGGSPLLMAELLRFVSLERDEPEMSIPSGSILLSEMIRHRAATLSPTARKLLEVLSVAGEPLSKSTLYLALKVTGDDPAREMWRLVNEHLVRVTGGVNTGKLEPFHDQVRQASLSWLSDKELRQWHAHLAAILQDEEEPDPQRLLRHYRGAGNMPAAFKAALEAANLAENALAFEQAAGFYQEALDTGQADEAMRADLQRKRAEALANAGRGYEAAQCFLEAAQNPASDTIEMRRQAAEQLMRGGHLDEGIEIFADLLSRAGIHVPSNRLESLVRMLTIRAYIRLRGLGWRERTEAQIPAGTLKKLDLLWSGAMALVATDTIFGSYLQALHMREALKAGEPFRMALSFGFAAIYESTGGTREYEHGRKLTSLTVQIAERLNDPYLTAMTEISWVGLDFLSGRVEDGMKHCRNASALLEKASGRATAWELGTFNMALIWFLGWGGRIRELAEKVPLVMADGRARGDVYAEVSARCSGMAHLVELAEDNPDRALAEVQAALGRWRKTAFDLPHFNGGLACIECYLYAGKTQEARQLLLDDWPAIRKSLFTRKSQLVRTTLYYGRGRTALAEWLRQPNKTALRKETETYAAKLVGVQSPWGAAFSRILRAGLMAGSHQKPDAIKLLAEAEQILQQQSLKVISAATARKRGELEGTAGTDRIAAADAFMRSEGILNPERMTAMYLPGEWLR